MNPKTIRLGNNLFNNKYEIIEVKTIDFDQIYSEPNEYIVNSRIPIKKLIGIKFNQIDLTMLGMHRLKSYLSDVWCLPIQDDTGVEFAYELHIYRLNDSQEVFLISENNDQLYLNINYVHELQNVYLDITGHDLILKF
jgi:hypothetical protein